MLLQAARLLDSQPCPLVWGCGGLVPPPWHGNSARPLCPGSSRPCLSHPSARRVAHILAAPDNNCYNDLRAALLVAHQLTAFQKAKKLFSSEPPGDHRPYEMLKLVHPKKGVVQPLLHDVSTPPHCWGPPVAHPGRPQGHLRPGRQG